MGSRVTFKVLDGMARRRAVAPDIRRIARAVASDAAARSPRKTGTLARGYRIVPGRDPATTLIVNDTPYALSVEYGSRRNPARPALGPALAATGYPRWPRRRA